MDDKMISDWCHRCKQRMGVVVVWNQEHTEKLYECWLCGTSIFDEPLIINTHQQTRQSPAPGEIQ